MRKLVFVGWAILFGITSYAQHREDDDLNEKLKWNNQMLNILVDTRIDYQNVISNGELIDRSFYGDLLKVWFTGDITPTIHYRVRQRLNKEQAANSRDGLSGATDLAWISFDIQDNWNIMVGKQSIQFGTFEYNYSTADVYYPTMIYNDLTSSAIGVNVLYKWKNQEFNFQVINSPYSEFASESYEDKALALNFLWEGSLFKGIYKTRWGYGLFQHSKDSYYNWFTVGNQINIGKFTSELDYYIGDRNMNYSSVVLSAPDQLRLVEDQAVSLKFMYNLGDWRPFIKAVYSQRYDKKDQSQAYNIKGIEAVVEWYPFTKELLKDLRFHGAYSFSNTEFKGDYRELTQNNQHQLLVGVRWLVKVK
ncbi:porin [Myroides sp. LJL119]